MTQGDLVSPTLFNVIKDNVIQEWLALTVEYKVRPLVLHCQGQPLLNDVIFDKVEQFW